MQPAARGPGCGVRAAPPRRDPPAPGPAFGLFGTLCFVSDDPATCPRADPANARSETSSRPDQAVCLLPPAVAFLAPIQFYSSGYGRPSGGTSFSASAVSEWQARPRTSNSHSRLRVRAFEERGAARPPGQGRGGAPRPHPASCTRLARGPSGGEVEG